MEFVGSFRLANQIENKYLLVMMNFFTNWLEAKTLRDNKVTLVAKFLYEQIITTFSRLIEIVNGQGGYFMNIIIKDLKDKHVIIHRKALLYYSHTNGKVESTHKTLQRILKKIIDHNRCGWDHKL